MDWTGNKKTTFVTLGASNHCDYEREEHDYYATDPNAVKELLKHEAFLDDILEPCIGGAYRQCTKTKWF